MKLAIGGFFELELNNNLLFHKEALALNSGRNSIEYILLANQYKKVYLPYYTCDVLLQPLLRNNILYEFYYIDNRFEPIFDFEKLTPNEGFLYTNYFGLKDDFIYHITSRYLNIVIDNAQSFFSMPQNGADTFYSPRKFFGLPDGGYVYCKKKIESDFEEDKTSIDRMDHLLKRLAFGAEEGYDDFKKSESILNEQPIMQMSKLTTKLLSNIDYEVVKKRRMENFYFLHKELIKSNRLTSLIDKVDIVAPLGYPYWVNNGKELRVQLQRKRIFTPVYWPNVFDLVENNTTEFELANNLICLPIDQRYCETSLQKILDLLEIHNL